MGLLIKNARLLDTEGLWDISVESDKIKSLRKAGLDNSDDKIDAEGGLVLSTFIEPHVHLDKVLLGEELKEATSISEARESIRNAKRQFTVENVKARMERVVPWALQNGVTIVRTHIDVDSIAKLHSIEAAFQLKKKYRDILNIQVVAFPQEGVVKDPGALELVQKALELGCEAVGGLPEAETSIEAAKTHVDLMLQLAQEKGLFVDMHCDVSSFGTNIEYFANRVLELGIGDMATADHLIALSYYDDDYASKIIALIKKASMNVITNPCTMMTSGTQDKPPKGRGITRVSDLLRFGVNVAFGSDNIVDPYNPMGNFNPLSNGFLLAYGAQLGLLSDLDSIVRMATTNSSRILGLSNYGIKPGSNADFNIFRERSVRELLQKHNSPKYVFKNGQNIWETRIESTQHP